MKGFGIEAEIVGHISGAEQRVKTESCVFRNSLYVKGAIVNQWIKEWTIK